MFNPNEVELVDDSGHAYSVVEFLFDDPEPDDDGRMVRHVRSSLETQKEPVCGSTMKVRSKQTGDPLMSFVLDRWLSRNRATGHGNEVRGESYMIFHGRQYVDEAPLDAA